MVTGLVAAALPVLDQICNLLKGWNLPETSRLFPVSPVFRPRFPSRFPSVSLLKPPVCPQFLPSFSQFLRSQFLQFPGGLLFRFQAADRLVYNRTRMTPFEWDPKKAATNVRKHGIRFADAVSVLEDSRAITVSDDSIDEQRWVTIGMDAVDRILVVVYTWRGEKIRIISARRATQRESQQYPENP